MASTAGTVPAVVNYYYVLVVIELTFSKRLQSGMCHQMATERRGTKMFCHTEYLYARQFCMTLILQWCLISANQSACLALGGDLDQSRADFVRRWRRFLHLSRCELDAHKGNAIQSSVFLFS